ncbi:capsule assembly Wzi family protein [Sabulibacter ruber]|uniref:capsule assembly Wzi family protein n=1 Tax=Sabulibacter ruber TaxID=2811901 RepID=UPI001A95A61E|nr:capsule assembly Wzi family protein [Sabulibacter ruber]
MKVEGGTSGIIATENHPPFWIEANRFGTVPLKQHDLITHLKIGNTHLFSRKYLPPPGSPLSSKAPFHIGYGVDVYNNSHFRDVFLKEAYLKVGYGAWELRGGRYAETVGNVDPELSSGSLAVSRNALPIPKVGVAVKDYVNIPHTNGFLKVKGVFSHGWLGNSNHVKGAYLHEKNLCLRIGRDALNVHAGLSHFAQWGGRHPLGQIPSRFKDYLRILVGAKGDETDPASQQGPVDIVNAVGNHVIVSDFGVNFLLKGKSLHLYTQTIFDKGVGSPDARDKINGLNVFSRDRLVGIGFDLRHPGLVSKVVIEGIYTKYQGGPVIYQGRFNYYNNATYLTGWDYQGQIIGTPLFLNRRHASLYNLDLSEGSPGNDWNVVSNRVTGLHVGLKGNLSTRISYRTLATYVQHAGNYYNDALFTSVKKQAYFYGELISQIGPSLTFTTAVGRDMGQLSHNTGGLLGVNWQIK